MVRRRRKQPRGEEAGAGAEPLGGGGGEGLAERRGGRGVDGSVGVATREDPGARDAGGGGEEERGAAAAAEEHSGRIAGRWAGSAVAHTRREQAGGALEQKSRSVLWEGRRKGGKWAALS